MPTRNVVRRDSIREFQRIRSDMRRFTRSWFSREVSNEFLKKEPVRSMEAPRMVDTGRSSVFRNSSGTSAL